MLACLRLRWLFVQIAVFYAIFWLFREYGDEYLAPVKASIDPYYGALKPYIGSAEEFAHVKVFDPVGVKVGAVYQQYLEPHVQVFNKEYYPVVELKVIAPLCEIWDTNLCPKLNQALIVTKYHVSIWSLKGYEHSKKGARFAALNIVKYGTIFKDKMVSVYVPYLCERCNDALRVLNGSVKPKLYQVSAQFIKPNLIKVYYLLKLDVAYQFFYNYYIKVVESPTFVSISNSIHSFYIDLVPKSYDEIEEKKNFVKSEFNKIFDAGFKLSNNVQEGLKSSNKILKDRLLKEELSKAEETPSSTQTTTSATTSTSTASQAAKTENEISKSINFWNSLVSKTCELAFDEFIEDVLSIQSGIIGTYKPKLTQELQDLTTRVSEGYRDLTRVIGTINSTDYSRQLFRDLLSDFGVELTSLSNQVKSTLKQESSDVSEAISKSRARILDTLEEFADFAVQEFSRELITDRKKDDEYWNNWKELSKIKEKLFLSREKLVKLEPLIPDLDKMIAEIESTLSIVINESGQYMALLRAKANLLFQLREERELALEQENNSVPEPVPESAPIPEKEQEVEPIATPVPEPEIVADLDCELDLEDEEDDVISTRTKFLTRTVSLP